MNLVVIAFEIEVRTRKLSLDDLPEPVYWRTKRDVRENVWSRAAGEEGNELAEGVDDDGPRISTTGKRTKGLVIGVDGYFHQILGA